MKTEAKAWGFLKERFQRFDVENDEYVRHGLCYAVICLRENAEISFRVATNMQGRILQFGAKHSKGQGYYWELTSRGAKYRMRFIERILKQIKKKKSL
jgi:hypothetical protein